MEWWQFIAVVTMVAVFGIAIIVLLLFTRKRDDNIAELLISHKNDNAAALERVKQEMQAGVITNTQLIGDGLRAGQNSFAQQMTERQDSYARQLYERQNSLSLQMNEKQTSMNQTILANAARSEERFKTFEEAISRELNLIRQTMESRISYMQEDNAKRIEDMRGSVDKRLDEVKNIVDEKLQRTLNERITESFKLVNERLTEVYKGLGEMQSLAIGVGDLKKALTNVKTRGTLGEVQLAAILEDILTPDQYVKNFDAKQRSNERVEYAIRLPNDGENPVYLPIDSKFPADVYMRLVDAYEAADSAAVNAAQKNLCDTITRFARDIRDKYINPPRTTDFAIMFLPTEGIYAEVVRLGMIEKLQRDAHVNIAGPSTMAALVNSLRMGFSNFAMQKRSSEAWRVLGAVKAEFVTFESTLLSAQKQLTKANDELEKLVGVRTRVIIRKLKDVETVPSAALLGEVITPAPVDDEQTI